MSAHSHPGALPSGDGLAVSSAIPRAKSLCLVRFQRFPICQGRRIPLAGLLGSVVLPEVSSRLFALLKAGEICGVGKGATMGQGSISV